MKLIHLNVESFKYFDALVDFLEVEKPDIISLVEATDGDFFWLGMQRDYLGELCEKFGWKQVFHPTVFRDFGDYKVGLWAAVLSRFSVNIIDKLYFWNQVPTILAHDNILFSGRPKYERYPISWRLNLPFLITNIQTDAGDLRLLTAHFHVSYECFETLQILEDAEKVAGYLNTTDLITPTIFTGDLNISNRSVSIKTIAEKITQQSQNFNNTLTPSIHPIFKKEPENPGHGVDHIFTREVNVASCELRQNALISDHLPLVLDFSL